MKWEGNRESDNVEDRRGGGGGLGGRSIGIGSIAIALVASYFFTSVRLIQWSPPAKPISMRVCDDCDVSTI